MPAKSVAAFFDFDNTLLAADSGVLGIKFLWKEKMLSPWFMLKIGLTNELFKRHLASSETITRMVYSLYKGHRLETFTEGSGDFYTKELRPLLSPVLMDRLAEHRAAGHRLVLLSAGVRYLLEHVKADLGFDDLLCTDLEQGEDGILTGRTKGEICVGEAKGRAASALAERVGIDLSASYAYADHHSDLPILSMVGHPVAVEPTEILRKEAENNAWEIIGHYRENEADEHPDAMASERRASQ